MLGKRVHTNIVRWYDILLRCRSMTAELQGVNRTARPGKGSPPGGIPSPIVWNIIMDTLLSQLVSGPVNALGYADDIMMVSPGIYVEVIRSQLHTALHQVHVWGLEEGLSFKTSEAE